MSRISQGRSRSWLEGDVKRGRGHSYDSDGITCCELVRKFIRVCFQYFNGVLLQRLLGCSYLGCGQCGGGELATVGSGIRISIELLSLSLRCLYSLQVQANITVSLQRSVVCVVFVKRSNLVKMSWTRIEPVYISLTPKIRL